MELVPLGPGFGVEVRGVSILDVASDGGAYKAVRAAFEEHSLLLFRDQPVAAVSGTRNTGRQNIAPIATQPRKPPAATITQRYGDCVIQGLRSWFVGRRQPRVSPTLSARRALSAFRRPLTPGSSYRRRGCRESGQCRH